MHVRKSKAGWVPFLPPPAMPPRPSSCPPPPPPPRSSHLPPDIKPLTITGVERDIKAKKIIYSIHFIDGTYGTYEIDIENLVKVGTLIDEGQIYREIR